MDGGGGERRTGSGRDGRGDGVNGGNRGIDDIVCFQCCKHKVFSLNRIPDQCPVCQADLARTQLTLPPFRIPNPFTSLNGGSRGRRGKQELQLHLQCKLVIRPSFGTGDFLHDYHNGGQGGRNLHVGVTDSQGRVVEYDADGLHLGDRDWGHQCLVVDLELGKYAHDPDWREYWDLCLQNTVQRRQPDAVGDQSKGRWTAEAYCEESRNCFTFVLDFLVRLRHFPLSKEAQNKVEFCRKYVLPKTTQAGKFIRMYRKLKANDGKPIFSNRCSEE